MKKMRLHILVVLAIFLVGFILGSFLDLQLSNAIFSRDNGFGLFIAAIGTIPGYFIFTILAGGYLAIALHKPYKLWMKILMYIAAVGLFGAAIFFTGREIFGPNGFYNEKLKWLGFLIVTPFAAGCAFLGYKLTKNSNNPYLWLIFAIIAFFIFMSLVPGVTLLKSIFHRPRYRSLVLFQDIDANYYFHNWWQRCPNYKDLMAAHDLLSEEFKSFPSGHVGASMVFVLAASCLPLIDQKYERLQLPLFYVGLAWALLVGFTRILVGAHFLSDVSMGGILTSIFMLINNEVLIATNNKLESRVEANNA